MGTLPSMQAVRPEDHFIKVELTPLQVWQLSQVAGAKLPEIDATLQSALHKQAPAFTPPV